MLNARGPARCVGEPSPSARPPILRARQRAEFERQCTRTLVEDLVLLVHHDGARRHTRHRRDRERRSSRRNTALADQRRGGREGSREGGEEKSEDDETEHDCVDGCESGDEAGGGRQGRGAGASSEGKVELVTSSCGRACKIAKGRAFSAFSGSRDDGELSATVQRARPPHFGRQAGQARERRPASRLDPRQAPSVGVVGVLVHLRGRELGVAFVTVGAVTSSPKC